LALAALLLILFPFMSPRSALTSDEGAYALQADALAHGTWAYDWGAADLDRNGTSFPLVLSTRHGDHFYPYLQHPAYPEMLRGVTAVVGSTLGLHLLALAGTVGTAVAAWFLAVEIDPRLRRRAFWLAALGPVLVNGFLLWAPALSAAAAGLMLVVVVRSVRRGPSPLLTAAAAAGAVAGVLLRSEGLLFALALALVAAGYRQRSFAPDQRWRRAATALSAFAAIAGPAVVATLAERAWVHHIAGGAYENLSARSEGSPWLAGRVSAAWHDLFEGPLSTGRGVLVSMGVMVALVGVGVIVRRRPAQAARAIGGGALLATGLTAALVLAGAGMPVPGLFAAWPVVFLGLILVPWQRLGTGEALMGATVAVFVAAVVATEYPAGGGVEWGGRFFFPVLSPLAVLAVVGFERRLAGLARDQVRKTVVVLTVAVVAVASLSLTSVGGLRARHARMIAAVTRHPARITVTTAGALPRLAWSSDDQITWMLTTPSSLPELLDHLRSRGVPGVAVVTDRLVDRADLAVFGSVEEIEEPALASRGLSLFVLSSR